MFIISYFDSQVFVHAVKQGYNIFCICLITRGTCNILSLCSVHIDECRIRTGVFRNLCAAR